MRHSFYKGKWDFFKDQQEDAKEPSYGRFAASLLPGSKSAVCSSWRIQSLFISVQKTDPLTAMTLSPCIMPVSFFGQGKDVLGHWKQRPKDHH